MYGHINCKRACCSEKTKEAIRRSLDYKRVPIEDKTCTKCGKSFQRKKSSKIHKSNNFFCSLKCLRSYGARRGISLSKESKKKLSIKYTGSGSPSWKGGISKDKEWIKERCRNNRHKNRKIVIDYYGGKCACCGEREYKFLAIDHIKNDGSKDRKKYKGSQTFQVAINEGLPKDKYQVLCHNCNFAKSHWNGCPHKKY